MQDRSTARQWGWQAKPPAHGAKGPGRDACPVTAGCSGACSPRPVGRAGRLARQRESFRGLLPPRSGCTGEARTAAVAKLLATPLFAATSRFGQHCAASSSARLWERTSRAGWGVFPLQLRCVGARLALSAALPCPLASNRDGPKAPCSSCSRRALPGSGWGPHRAARAPRAGGVGGGCFAAGRFLLGSRPPLVCKGFEGKACVPQRPGRLVQAERVAGWCWALPVCTTHGALTVQGGSCNASNLTRLSTPHALARPC